MYEHYLIVYCLGAFIMDKKNRLLIVKKSAKEQIDPGMWVVPEGKVKPNENIIKALKREVKEYKIPKNLRKEIINIFTNFAQGIK